MTFFALNHPKIAALLLSSVISAGWLGGITAGFTPRVSSDPRVVQLPPVVITGKRFDLDTQSEKIAMRRGVSVECH